jgi:phosphomannomutase
MAPTGHSFIKSLMNKHNAVFGGELSGHYFFKDRYFGYDDAIYAMLRLIELTAFGYDVGQFLALLPQFTSSPDIQIPCDDTQKFQIIDTIKAYLISLKIHFVAIDGIRYQFDKGWWIIRASNTSPCITIRFESFLEEDYTLVKENIAAVLKHAMPHVDFDEYAP